jgi:hypothetical protein
MLSKLSASVAECYQHAGECARRAKIAGSPRLQDEFLNLERSWLKLARSIEASERFNAFIQAEQNTE